MQLCLKYRQSIHTNSKSTPTILTQFSKNTSFLRKALTSLPAWRNKISHPWKTIIYLCPHLCTWKSLLCPSTCWKHQNSSAASIISTFSFEVIFWAFIWRLTNWHLTLRKPETLCSSEEFAPQRILQACQIFPKSQIPQKTQYTGRQIHPRKPDSKWSKIIIQTAVSLQKRLVWI